MNISKLKQAEAEFLSLHPGGFLSPEMVAIVNKHKVGKMVELSQDCFKKSRFKNTGTILESMVKVISRSSMVSMFEKPKFKRFVDGLPMKARKKLSDSLRQQLHGDERKGFESLVELMLPAKLAKWSLITIIPNYFRPDDEVFVKPTTAKGIIEQFELLELHYHPRPIWEFYEAYRSEILKMRQQVDPTLTPNNAAFCGFLMMSLQSR